MAKRALVGARLLAIAGATLLAAGCSPATGAHPAAKVVPFAPLAVVAPPSPTPVASTATSCRADQIAGARAPDMALTGQQLLLSLTIWNKSSTTCQLEGSPTVQLLAASGANVPISLQPSWSQLAAGPGSSGPVVLRARMTGAGPRGAPLAGEAVLTLLWSPVLDDGPSCPSPAPTAATVEVATSKGDLAVDVAPTSGVLEAPFAPCEGELGVGPFQASAASTTPSPTPPAARPHLLRGRLVLPPDVRAGAVLRFEVVLHNLATSALSLGQHCGGYAVGVVGPSHYKVVREYQLNCAAAGTIGAGMSRTFAMELPTSTSSGSGRLDLTWAFEPDSPLQLSPGPGLAGHLRLLAHRGG